MIRRLPNSEDRPLIAEAVDLLYVFIVSFWEIDCKVRDSKIMDGGCCVVLIGAEFW